MRGLLGMSPVHQELHLEPYLSVAENIFLGRQPIGRLGLVDYAAMNRKAARLLGELGVRIDPAASVGSISIAQRQIVAIARAISIRVPRHHLRRADLLADGTRGGAPLPGDPAPEPPGHRRDLHLAPDGGDFPPLRPGDGFPRRRYVATKPVNETSMRDLIAMMIGRDLSELFRKEPAPIGETVLEVRGVCVRGILDNVSLTVRKGEIVGLAGLVGAGRTELARAIFGDIAIDAARWRSVESRSSGPIRHARRSPRA